MLVILYYSQSHFDPQCMATSFNNQVVSVLMQRSAEDMRPDNAVPFAKFHTVLQKMVWDDVALVLGGGDETQTDALTQRLLNATGDVLEKVLIETYERIARTDTMTEEYFAGLDLIDRILQFQQNPIAYINEMDHIDREDWIADIMATVDVQASSGEQSDRPAPDTRYRGYGGGSLYFRSKSHYRR